MYIFFGDVGKRKICLIIKMNLEAERGKEVWRW